MTVTTIRSPRPARPVTPAAPAAPTAAEMKLANAFVKRNAGGAHGSAGAGKLFPAIDAGESGLMGAVLTGKQAAGLLELGHEAGNDKLRKGKLGAKELLIAVVTTDYSEPVVYVAAMDRKSGKGRLVGELELTTVSSDVDAAKFTRFFGKPSDYEASALAEKIATAGKKLALPGKPG